MPANGPKAGSSRRSSRRRRTPKPVARDAWEAALAKLEGTPRKAAEETAIEFLPRFVAALRDKGYVQNEIVERIIALNLGLTDREIRAVDKQLRHGGAAPARPHLPASAAAVVTAPASVRAGGRAPHAGLATDEGLHRR